MRKFSPSKLPPADEAPLGSKPLEAIGRALRAHYDDLLREPLPARFQELLARLEAEETAKEDGEKPGQAETE